ncbi:MAG: 50S ribosomal protein L2 [Patescibacteria group bacterium]
MPIKKYNANNSGRRIASVDAYQDITKWEPEKKLIIIRKKHSGRTNGTITVRHQGGGHKRYIRLVDFYQKRYDIPATVIAIEYDPNRNSRIALIEYTADKERAYIVAPDTLAVGATVISSQKAIDAKLGTRMPLEFIPVGTFLHNIELAPGTGAKVARSAGVQVQLMAIEGKFAHVKMPSGEVRLIPKEASASVGMVSNPDHRLVRLGKAGRSRHRGIRPSVRGKVMNPVDHPHGGGEGKNSIGLKAPKTPWGKKALGVKTRKPKKASDRFIVSRRPRRGNTK